MGDLVHLGLDFAVLASADGLLDGQHVAGGSHGVHSYSHLLALGRLRDALPLVPGRLGGAEGQREEFEELGLDAGLDGRVDGHGLGDGGGVARPDGLAVLAARVELKFLIKI